MKVNFLEGFMIVHYIQWNLSKITPEMSSNRDTMHGGMLSAIDVNALSLNWRDFNSNGNLYPSSPNCQIKNLAKVSRYTVFILNTQEQGI